ncbi:MAG: peptidase S58 family protein [Dehalococcoidia bacterium]|nr:peptidase S58 family protein [Dehalococcoidia bacterium]
MSHNAVTDVAPLRVGHYTDLQGITGCTVVLCEGGAVAGVFVSGAAPGTRETDLLGPGMLVERVHAVLLSGGSAFGLAAADGVMRFLEERGAGFDTRFARVPIVPAAILYDLGIGDARLRPDAAAGYQACAAATDGPVAEGSVGAGTGATVGKALGMEWATKAGLGTASVTLPDGTVVAAMAAVNAAGEVVDPDSGAILAGVRDGKTGRFIPTAQVLLSKTGDPTHDALTNTTLAVVATDAVLSKSEAHRLARMADAGLARTLRPAHGMTDGDVVFALATGRRDTRYPLTLLGTFAAEVLARAVVRAVRQATGLGGVPSAQEFLG